MYSNIILEKKDKVYCITMNRPEALNALSDATITEMHNALDVIEADTEARIVVITGNGKAFIAGADIKQMCEMNSIEAQKFSYHFHDLYRRIELSDKIFIAAINGYAFGGGLELALCCDIRIASVRAKLALPEVSLGIIPGGGGTQRLSRICGEGIAKYIVITGDTIQADKALSYGIVSAVVASEYLMPTCNEIIKKILSNGPNAVSYAKHAVHSGYQMDLISANDYENRLFGLCFSGDEQKEGMKAFIEKRPANF